jgi:DNA polymerase I-like protein with 3'-5' exonuclease and polymerase domains
MSSIQSESLDLRQHTEFEIHQIYCGLDNALTNESLTAEYELFDSNTNPRPHARAIYNFERALQAPYMDIMLRGFAVDVEARWRACEDLKLRIARIDANLQRMGQAIWNRPIIPRSNKNLRELFFETMKFPEIITSKKGVKKVSLDRSALEKLHDNYLYARPFVSHILAIRDLAKQLEVMETEVDEDFRFRSSYNIAGTESGRPSSSESSFGTGGNAQNLSPGLRHVFIPDPGYKLFVIDFEQSEARDVGFIIGCLFGDWSYLDACESGDLHTNNAKLVWPELPWTGDPRSDREIANRTFYRDFTYRDMSKRGGHLTNYNGTAYTMGRHLKIPQKTAQEFQDRYCRGNRAAFPCIPLYWQWCIESIQTNYKIVTPFGRERHFFGDTHDDATAREAIAFVPQSTTSDRTNLGFWRTWKYVPEAKLLAQGYDSITFELPDDTRIEERVRRVVHNLRTRMVDPKSGRSFEVPVEVKAGYNWGYFHKDKNPRGLKKFEFTL